MPFRRDVFRWKWYPGPPDRRRRGAFSASTLSLAGAILARGSTGWKALLAGVLPQVLKTNGPGNLPSWGQVATNELTTVTAAPSAGQLGELKSSTVLSGSAVSLVNNTNKDITSIALTAGVWLCWGAIDLVPGGSNANNFVGWINTASATLPTAPNSGAETVFQAALSFGLVSQLPVGQMVVIATNSTTIYLSTQVNFPGTCTAYGFLGALRIA